MRAYRPTRVVLPAAPRTVTLRFTREFVSGHLKGLQHSDELSFGSFDDALQWVRAINGKADAGRCDYKIVASQASEL